MKLYKTVIANCSTCNVNDGLNIYGVAVAWSMVDVLKLDGSNMTRANGVGTGPATLTSMLARLRPYWLHAYLLTYTPILLFADSRITALWQQWMLGLLTFAALYLSALKAPKEQRLQVWTCVIVATGFEIFGSLIWGVYRYRLHNVPLFVPPGHGMVYLFGLLAARTPVVLRYG